MSAGLYFFLFYRPRPLEDFLQSFVSYSDQELEKEWPTLVKNAKTSTEYLALLQVFFEKKNLDDAYITTLMQAMNRYQENDAFLALAVYYSLENPSSMVFSRYLSPVSIKKLYQSYPEIAQRYAISNISDTIDSVFLEDETLFFAQKIILSEANDDDLFFFWKISKEEKFLYASILLSMIYGKTDSVENRVQLLSEEWKNDPLRRSQFLSSKFVATDEFFISSDTREEEIVTVALLMIKQFGYEDAYALLESYMQRTRQSENTVDYKTHLLYLWLRDRLGYSSRTEYEEIYALYGSQFEYLYYAYLKRNNMDVSFLDTESLLQRQEYRLLQAIKASNTPQQISGLLWEELYQNPTNRALEFTLLFFIRNEFYSDAIILLNEYNENSNLSFYEFYLEQVLSNAFLTEDFLVASLLNNLQVAQQKWWQFYNVGLFFLNSSQINSAIQFLERARDLVVFYNDTVGSVVYAQLSRAHALNQDKNSALQNYRIFVSLYPSSPYGEELEQYLREENILK